MLLQLLTLLLPARASERELTFHREFIRDSFREFYWHLEATGYRDRDRLRRIRRDVEFSMKFLPWRERHHWQRWYERAGSLKSVTPLEKVHELLPRP